MLKKNGLKHVSLFSSMLVLFSVVLLFAANKKTAGNDFYFVQLSDTHWGFDKTNINPDYTGTLKKAVAQVNNLAVKPDFIIFTGDLTHTTDDPQVRKQRMTEFKTIIGELKVTNIYFIPGEHDAALDKGEAFKENFGKTYYTFTRKGVNFIALDNVSDPASSLGDAQIKWLGGVLKKLNKNSRIVVFSHRPLFDLNPLWDWWTRDGAKATELFKPFKNVTVFYGHIHQENHTTTNDITYHAAKGLMYPLTPVGTADKKAQIPWDPANPYKDLGFRTVEVKTEKPEYILTEYPILADRNEQSMQSSDQSENVIQVTAKKFEYTPNEIHIKKGVTTILEFTTLDTTHGFTCPGLNVRTSIEPGKTARVTITADKAGEYGFACDIFCGDGHSDMTGKIIVEE